jgi:hypothetical protein
MSLIPPAVFKLLFELIAEVIVPIRLGTPVPPRELDVVI